MSSAGQPINPGGIVTPTVQGTQAPMSQWQQMQQLMRQRAMAQMLMQGNQQRAATPLQSATNAMGSMAGAWGQNQVEGKMQSLLQNNPQLAQQAQANPGLLDRMRSFLSGTNGQQAGSSSAGAPTTPGQTPNVQLGPQNSMPTNLFGMGPPSQ